MEVDSRPALVMRTDDQREARRASPYGSPNNSPHHSRRPSKSENPMLAEPTNDQGPPPVDCPICQLPMTDPSVGGGCCHHFCQECYEEWAQRKANCPTCRAPVWNIKLDVEFAAISGCVITPKAMAKVKASSDGADAVTGLREAVQIAWPAGLTLTNSANNDGVRVVKTVRGNGAYNSGLRSGDVIVSVNGTPVNDHARAVEFIEQRCRNGDCVVDVRTPTFVGSPVTVLRRASSRFLPRRRSSPLARVSGSNSESGGSADEGSADEGPPSPTGTRQRAVRNNMRMGMAA